jgi:hypothetical protein
MARGIRWACSDLRSRCQFSRNNIGRGGPPRVQILRDILKLGNLPKIVQAGRARRNGCLYFRSQELARSRLAPIVTILPAMEGLEVSENSSSRAPTNFSRFLRPVRLLLIRKQLALGARGPLCAQRAPRGCYPQTRPLGTQSFAWARRCRGDRRLPKRGSQLLAQIRWFGRSGPATGIDGARESSDGRGAGILIAKVARRFEAREPPQIRNAFGLRQHVVESEQQLLRIGTSGNNRSRLPRHL